MEQYKSLLAGKNRPYTHSLTHSRPKDCTLHTKINDELKAQKRQRIENENWGDKFRGIENKHDTHTHKHRERKREKKKQWTNKHERH